MNFGKFLCSLRYRVGLAACVILVLLFGLPALADEGDTAAAIVEKAARRSTLDQEGTHPFHLKATFAASRERDKESRPNGDIEIWWQSPTVYRRELRTPDFHRVEIVNNSQRWQKNEGGYFPHWLEQAAVAIIRPIPDLPRVLQNVRDSDIRHIPGGKDAGGKDFPPRMYCQWSALSTNGHAQSGIGAAVAIAETTGLIFYAGAPGWGALYEDYKDFHGRSVGRTVKSGSPEATARITILEDLKDPAPELFDASVSQPSSPLDILYLDEMALRRNLLAGSEIKWPAVENGPFEGTIGAEVVIDREGKVHEVPAVVSGNPALSDAARNIVLAMRFDPFVVNGVPVEVFSRITLPFKTSRPVGSENFASAATYFDQGRKASFLSAGGKSPYVHRAVFSAKLSDGTLAQGQYEDTWLSNSQWRREAHVGKSTLTRARSGEKWYRLEEGPDAKLLALVLEFIEPIPALDTFTESDWRVRRETLDGAPAIRVLSGYESPEGQLDPEHARAFWFNSQGVLLKSFGRGIEVRRSEFEEHDGVRTARQVGVYRQGKLAMLIRTTEVIPAINIPVSTFELPKHEWHRSFTAEER